MVVDIGGVKSQLLATGRLYKALRYLLRFCLNSECKFWISQFLGEGVPLWWCMARR